MNKPMGYASEETRVASGLPVRCYAFLGPGHEMVEIVRGGGMETCGVCISSTGVDALNELQGTTKRQVAAMLAACQHGWDSPAADPDNYDADGVHIRNLPANGCDDSSQRNPAHQIRTETSHKPGGANMNDRTLLRQEDFRNDRDKAALLKRHLDDLLKLSRRIGLWVSNPGQGGITIDGREVLLVQESLCILLWEGLENRLVAMDAAARPKSRVSDAGSNASRPESAAYGYQTM